MSDLPELAVEAPQCSVFQTEKPGGKRRRWGSHRSRNKGPGSSRGGTELDERRWSTSVAATLGRGVASACLGEKLATGWDRKAEAQALFKGT